MRSKSRMPLPRLQGHIQADKMYVGFGQSRHSEKVLGLDIFYVEPVWVVFWVLPAQRCPFIGL